MKQIRKIDNRFIIKILDMSYFDYTTKVLAALRNDPITYNKELLKGFYWMQINNEDIEHLILWVEKQKELDSLNENNY